MTKRKTVNGGLRKIVAVSGGGDSVYLLHHLLENACRDIIAVHINHSLRGVESDEDQDFVEAMARRYGIPFVGRRGKVMSRTRGVEEGARSSRYVVLQDVARKSRATRIFTGHTADDQVETILMRFFEGAGIAGLKGIPRETDEGIVRPILDVWKEDILKYLKENKIPFRVDRSNFDTRFERNWIRHALIPLLVMRYGKSVKKRIFTLGDRFRELDDYLDAEAGRWIRRNVKPGISARGGGNIVGKVPTTGNGGNPKFPRGAFSRLPAVLRVKVLQRICYDRLGLAPNERLLAAMDRLLRECGPSASVKVGKGWELKNRYGEAAFVHAGDGRKSGNTNDKAIGRPAVLLPGMATGTKADILLEEKGMVTPAQARRAAAPGRREYFDASGVRLPLSVRPLRAGDRIRPFGLDADKKVKEILIDRKVPRDERWGRPAVCDAEGKILWIPGVVRSAHAPVTPQTRKTIHLEMKPEKPRKPGPSPRSRSRSRK